LLRILAKGPSWLMADLEDAVETLHDAVDLVDPEDMSWFNW
jgi:hypothetical protein